jgi:hypothetical protein
MYPSRDKTSGWWSKDISPFTWSGEITMAVGATEDFESKSWDMIKKTNYDNVHQHHTNELLHVPQCLVYVCMRVHVRLICCAAAEVANYAMCFCCLSINLSVL